MTNEITINKSILHVLDTNASIPVLSDALLNMNQTVSEFIEKHVNKTVKDPWLKEPLFGMEVLLKAEYRTIKATLTSWFG